MSTALMFSLALLGAPAASATSPEPHSTMAELQEAIDTFADTDPQSMISSLERLLRRLRTVPEHACLDPDDASTLLRAEVILAGLYLLMGNEAAADTMDEAIRSARDLPLPVADYGPTIIELFEQRKAALAAAGTAILDVKCTSACTVVINERLSPAGREQLLLGNYRVWIKASEGDAAWEHHEVELMQPDEVHTIDYQPPRRALPPAPPPPPVDEPDDRMLPRGVEIVGALVGIGLIVGGAVLVSVDGKCTDHNAMSGTCAAVRDTNRAGGALLGFGGAMLLAFTPVLIVDEVQLGKQRGRQVMVGLAWKF